MKLLGGFPWKIGLYFLCNYLSGKHRHLAFPDPFPYCLQSCAFVALGQSVLGTEFFSAIFASKWHFGTKFFSAIGTFNRHTIYLGRPIKIYKIKNEKPWKSCLEAFRQQGKYLYTGYYHIMYWWGLNIVTFSQDMGVFWVIFNPTFFFYLLDKPLV